MEAAEGVGLVTAMAVSGGFILLSKILDSTVNHMLKRRRQFPCAHVKPPARRSLFSAVQLRPELWASSKSPPTRNDLPSPHKPDDIESHPFLGIDDPSFNQRTEKLMQSVSSQQEITHTTSTSDADHETGPKFLAPPEQNLPSPESLHPKDSIRVTARYAHLRRGKAGHAGRHHSHEFVSGEHEDISALARKYHHESEEPCSLVKKYLERIPNEKRPARWRRHRKEEENHNLHIRRLSPKRRNESPNFSASGDRNISKAYVPSVDGNNTSMLLQSSSSVTRKNDRVRSKKVRFSVNVQDPLREQRSFHCQHELRMVPAQEIGTDCENHSTTLQQRRPMRSCTVKSGPIQHYTTNSGIEYEAAVRTVQVSQGLHDDC